MHRSSLRSRKYFWFSFLLEAETTGRIMSVKNSNKQHDLSPFAVQCLNQLRYPVHPNDHCNYNKINLQPVILSRYQCPRGMSRSAAGCRLSLGFRILPGTWIFDCCDHSSRGVLPTAVRHCVWSKNLKHEETMALVGPQPVVDLYIDLWERISISLYTLIYSVVLHYSPLCRHKLLFTCTHLIA